MLRRLGRRFFGCSSRSFHSKTSSVCPRIWQYSGLVFFGSAFAAALCVVPWKRLALERAEKKQADEQLAPIEDAARTRALTFEQLTSMCGEAGCRGWTTPKLQPSAMTETQETASQEVPLGAPVLWCIDHPSVGISYVDGNPQRNIFWTDETRIPIRHTMYDRCWNIVAIVRGVRADAILLEYKGISRYLRY